MFGSKVTASSLGLKKGKILGIFTKTKEDLNVLIQEEQNYVSTLRDEKKRIESEIDTVNDSIEESALIVDNINKILNTK